jgi:nucleoside-diphosphate-sugar epimerase
MIYEDGLQRRDFVSVQDVVRACRLALEVPETTDRIFNVGSGRDYTVLELAERVAGVLDATASPISRSPARSSVTSRRSPSKKV